MHFSSSVLLAGFCTKMYLRWYLLISLSISLGGILLISCSSVLLVLSTNPGPINRKIHFNYLNTVLVDCFDTFLYNQIEVRKADDIRCPDCEVEVYSFYLDQVIVDNHYFNISSDILTATHDDIILSPMYFISDSTIRLSVTFYPSNNQNSTVEFLLFNNLDLYDSFQNGEKPDPYQKYSVRVNEIEKTFSKVIKLPNTGYFFLGIRPSDSSVTFQYQLNVHQIYYSRDNFPSRICLLDALTKSCTVPFTVSYTDDYTDKLHTYIFVYSIPPPNFPESYYVSLEYNVQRGFWNSRSVGLVSVIGLSALCVSVLCCCCLWLCLCKCLKGHQRKSNFY